MPNLVPFIARASRCKFGEFYRYSLPLAAASATTCHKAQGITAKNGVVLDPSDVYSHSRKQWTFPTGLEYVGASRTTSLDKLVVSVGIWFR